MNLENIIDNAFLSLIKQIRNSRFSWLYKATILPRARKKVRLILPALNPNSKIIEIGSGNCGLAHLLQKEGHSVTATDIVDCSFFDDVKPIIFNGKNLHLDSKSFDYVLIVTVLHHTTHQVDLLSEAKRLGKEVIVMEDIFTHELGKRILHFTDSLINLEFKGHPHTNRTNKAWKRLFTELGFELKKSFEIRALLYFRQVVYFLGV